MTSSSMRIASVLFVPLFACAGGYTDGIQFPRVDTSVCATGNGGCDAHASCAPDSAGQAVCTCKVALGYEGDGLTCTDVLGQLNGLRWELPCSGPAGSGLCNTTSTQVSMILSAPSSRQYSIALRFRGVVEPRNYTGGSNDGAYWQIGGDIPASSDTFNIYKLEISAPPQVYYLNRGREGPVVAIDYTKTIPITGGATITLVADAVDGIESDNHPGPFGTGTPLVIPGIPPAPAAYDGQFIQMDIVR